MTLALPSFAPPDDLELAEPYWSAIRRGQLVLPQCSVCGSWQWYPERSGTDCKGGTLRWERVAPAGTLYSKTKVHRSFLPGGGDQVPYAVGLVDLDGVDGPRIVAPLSSDVAIGDRVAAQFVLDGDRPPLAVFGPEQTE